MAELVPARKKTLEMQWSHRVIHACQPLRHSIIVRVLCAEGKLLKTARHGSRPAPGAASQAAIGAEFQERRITISNQSRTVSVVLKNIALRNRGTGRAERGTDQIVVEKRRTRRELGLFQRQQTVLIPRRLLEGGK